MYRFFLLFLTLLTPSISSAKDDYMQAKEVVKRGFQAPSYNTNFPSVQLFSIADIGPKTYNINSPSSLKMTRSSEYKPISEAVGCPMVRVKASTVIIDLNGTTIFKSALNGNSVATENCVGIEVGYSPREIVADANLQQPQNIVIKNGVLADFDVGIVVHTGVKSVTFENLTIMNSAVGVVCLGLESPAAGAKGKVASCSFKNVKVVGQNAAGRSVLVGGQPPLDWSKAKFENSDGTGLNASSLGYGYGSDVFMPLAHNPVADDTSCYVYSGVVFDTVENIMLSNLQVTNYGFDGDAGGSTAEVSVAQGLVIRNSTTVFGENVESLNHVSAMTATSLHLDNVMSCSMKHGVFGDTSIEQQEAATSSQGLAAFGVYAANSNAMTFHDIVCNRNVGVTSGYGLYLKDSNVFDLDNISLDYNDAALVKGLYGNNVQSIVMKNSTANYNVGTTTTAFSAGIGFNNCNAVSMQNCAMNYNKGGNVAGLLVQDSQSYDLQDMTINYNIASGKVAGIYCDSGIKTFDIRKASINNNSSTGDTVTGVHMKDARAITMKDINCNYNNSQDGGSDVTGFLFEADALPVGLTTFDLENAEINSNWSADAAAKVKGLIIEAGESITMNNVNTNGNNGLDEVMGFEFQTSVSSMVMKDVAANGNSSSGDLVKGFSFDDAQNVSIENGFANGNNTTAGTGAVYGIDFIALETVQMRDIYTNNNSSFGSNVFGVAMDNGKSVHIDGFSSNYNQSEAASIAYGMSATTALSGGDIKRASLDHNIGGAQSYGLSIIGPDSIYIEDSSFSSNSAGDTSVGVYLQNGGTVIVKNSGLNGNNVTDVSVASENVLQVGDISKHGPGHFTAGAYGAFIDSTDGIIFEDVQASKNSGFRSAGIFAKDITDGNWTNCLTSFQTATGNYFIDNPFDGLDMALIDVPDLQAPKIFGGIASNATIDVVASIKDLFENMTQIKILQDLCEYDPSSVDEYNYRKTIASTQLLIRATMAQFRRYGTAIGMHLHNCSNCSLTNHIASGNSSTKDSAIGFAATGTTTGHIIESGSFSCNDAWTDSKESLTGDIDISAVHDLWSKLGLEVLTADGADTTTAIPTIITADHLDRLPATQPDPALNSGRLVVSFTSGAAPFYELIHPIGGIGAGIIIGDAAENVEVRNSSCVNNHGSAGQAYGIMQDVTTSFLAQDNRLYQTSVNTLGFCFGVAEFNFQSNSVHAGNVMFANAIARGLNSNFFVPYNPENPTQLTFQLKTIHNGDFSVMANALAYDNIEIAFVDCKPLDKNLPDNVKSDWLSGSYANEP